MAVRHVQVWKFCQLTGYTDEAVRGKIKRGQWLEGKVWKKAPDGHILIDLEEYDRWAAGYAQHHAAA